MLRPLRTAGRRGGRKLAPLLVAGLTLIALAAVGAASAASTGEPGGLRLTGCLSSSGTGCKKLSLSLSGPTAVAVSSDGRSVYVSAFGADAVAGFSRGAHGSLSFRSCVTEASTPGCGQAPKGALDGAAGLAVSPSGADVYVAANEGDNVVRLARGGGAAIGFAGCTGATEGCAEDLGGSLSGATGLALGPGGSDLYVASFAGTVTRLVRAADGSLRPEGCLAYGRAFGCHNVPGNSLVGADAIAVSPDGHDVYVASFSSGAVLELRRRPSGALAYRGCLAEGGGNQCRKLAKGSLSGASGIAVSPDGDDVYVAAQAGTVTRLRRSPNGRLSFGACLATDGLNGCAKAPGGLLKGATGIAVAPNGVDLYLTAQRADALVHLRAGARSIGFAGCETARGTSLCSRVTGTALRGPYGVAVSPAGNAVYTTGVTSGSVAGFARR